MSFVLPSSADRSSPLVAALDMGYGHLRPARALADATGTDVLRIDRSPVADSEEERIWRRIRTGYENTTRWTGLPLIGGAFTRVVNRFTDIPKLHPHRDQSAAPLVVRRFHRMLEEGLGDGIVQMARDSGRPLLTTYFAAAHAADRAGCERVWCVVTDSDIHRIWAPLEPEYTSIRFLAPSTRVLRRLRAYGVPRENIHVTGYPLPAELIGDGSFATCRANFARRLVRLDPDGSFRETHRAELGALVDHFPADEEGRPPRITFAVGGAGAQVEIVEQFLPGLAPEIEAGRWRLTLVAGVRREVRERFEEELARVGLSVDGDAVQIVQEDSHDEYFWSFNRTIAETDVLWSKPSEISFFAALGVAMITAPPVGVHERYNRRWLREVGGALKQREPRYAHQWLREWLADGLLAGVAWSAFMRLPKAGLHRIVELVGG